jgi:hypothetical protein
MGLEARLRRLESKVIPANTQPEQNIDLDQCIAQLGLVPVAVRESAQSKGSSLVEVMCEMLGIKAREFKRQLQEAAKLGR